VSENNRSEPGRVRRRRFLSGVGATGLAAAVAVFGRSTAASATYNVGCCTLQFTPTKTIAQCLAGRHYVWYCSHAGYVQCQCCEVKNSSGNNIASAWKCT
jgi:hypothetical protein